MTLPVQKEEGFTYQDYLSWPDEERWEIIEGRAHAMSPVPKPIHQKIVWNLAAAIDRQKEKLSGCAPFIAPTDVVLDEKNVVQPDLFIICDPSKITENNISGAPDLIIEVVSPNTEVKDRREKFKLYERFGVKEYVIVYPEREYAEIYRLHEGKYGAPEIINWDEILKLVTIDLEIPLWEIFEKEPPHPREETEENENTES